MMERPLPPAAAAYAADVDRVIWLVHLLMLALAAGWAAYFLWALVRFRRNRHPRADAVGASGRLALGVACSQLCGLAHFACAVS
jgi:heme/copper-type cytochrome/quinol oxidase subunit 2